MIIMYNIKKNLFLIKLILLALIKNKKYLKLAFVFHDRSTKFKLICANLPIKYSANYYFFTKIRGKKIKEVQFNKNIKNLLKMYSLKPEDIDFYSDKIWRIKCDKLVINVNTQCVYEFV